MKKTLPVPNAEKKKAAQTAKNNTVSTASPLTPPTAEAKATQDMWVEKEHTCFRTRDGKQELYVRNCYKSGKVHGPHLWMSYWFGGTPKVDNAVCDGSGKVPEAKGGYYANGTTTTVYKKKDYSEDAENFPVSDPITVTQARKIAYDMHKNQKDKAGEPYRLHLNAVEKGVVVLGGSDEERIAALFHDAVEDYHTTYDLLEKINVTEHTRTMIEAVSKRSSEEQTLYLARIVKAGPGAMRVKLADLMHNTRHDRIQALRDDKKDYVADRLLKKYRPAMAALMLELGMIIDTDEQKKIATKPQGTAGGWTSTSTGATKGNKVTGPKQSYNNTTHKWEGQSTGQSWTIASILPSDWPAGWSAPVLDKEPSEDNKSVAFYLADGSVRTEAKHGKNGNPVTWWVYNADEWWTDQSIKFPGVTEQMIAEFHDAVEAMMEAGQDDDGADDDAEIEEAQAWWAKQESMFDGLSGL